jgi:hypothetical protein
MRRLAEVGVRPAAWRSGRIVAAFWWDGHPNFGDDLTPWLLPRYGLIPVLRSPSSAQLSGVGSIVEFLPETFAGAVWGSGLMEERPRSLPHATVLAVRGHHTRDLLDAPASVALGDPGLLISRHLPRPSVRWELALVPHGHHRDHPGLAGLVARGGDRVRVVNVHQRAQHAARHIAACRAVITTSLHGLVTADAYGIPAVWTVLDPPLGGGDFKFRDYESVVSPGRTRFLEFSDDLSVDDILRAAWSVNADLVSRAGDELERALARVPDVIAPLPAFPSGVPRTLRG